jgi:hypothetical protein
VPGSILHLRLLLSALLCVLILTSSVDRIPDPPCTKPHHQTEIAQAVSGESLPMAHQHELLDLVVLLLEAQRWRLDFARQSDRPPLLCSLVYLDHAADPSPPATLPDC